MVAAGAAHFRATPRGLVVTRKLRLGELGTYGRPEVGSVFPSLCSGGCLVLVFRGRCSGVGGRCLVLARSGRCSADSRLAVSRSGGPGLAFPVLGSVAPVVCRPRCGSPAPVLGPFPPALCLVPGCSGRSFGFLPRLISAGPVGSDSGRARRVRTRGRKTAGRPETGNPGLSVLLPGWMSRPKTSTMPGWMSRPTTSPTTITITSPYYSCHSTSTGESFPISRNPPGRPTHRHPSKSYPLEDYYYPSQAPVGTAIQLPLTATSDLQKSAWPSLVSVHFVGGSAPPFPDPLVPAAL